MTPRQAREQQTQLELEKGRAMVARNERRDVLEKWISEGYVSPVNEGNKTIFDKPGAQENLGRRFQCGNEIFEDPLAHYPTEQLIARIALAIQCGAVKPHPAPEVDTYIRPSWATRHR